MVRVYEQALPARRWTERRRLSNVARGAAEGLEGPAGTERLDPTLSRRSLRQRLGGSFPSEPAVREQLCYRWQTYGMYDGPPIGQNGADLPMAALAAGRNGVDYPIH